MIRFLTVVASLAVFALSASAQIGVSDNHKFLTEKNGLPFFWLGDTDWELFHRLTREEADEVLEVRSRQGFNVIQAVALAEFNGIHGPNRYGDLPLINGDPTQLAVTSGSNPANADEYDYWDHVDYVINKAAEKGLYIGLLPTWGDKVAHLPGDGPLIFNSQNAETYGATLAQRYKKSWNVIWILGGDRPAIYTSKEGRSYDDRPIWRAMAKGIEAQLGKEAFITYHPAGGSYSTVKFIHDEPWLDMNSFQSGHGSRDTDAWNWVARDLSAVPQKPTLDMEPCYEDHPVNPWDGKWTRQQRGYFSAFDVRARIYRGVFAGACGVTYGHHQVWQFLNKQLYDPINVGDTLIGWRTALLAEAAGEVRYLKNLMLSRPYFTRVGDQALVKNPGSTYVDLVVATRDELGSYAMVYLPEGKPVMIDLNKVSGKKKNTWWFDPRTGVATAVADGSASGFRQFIPPVSGRDWVLVVDDASLKLGAPGSTPADK